MIDVGSSLGVQKDTLYMVYADGKSIFGLNGELLGRDKIPLAVLKVRDTDIQFSTCTVAPPSKSAVIQRGDKIEPISASDAKSLAARKVLPEKRPAQLTASNSAAELLMGGGNSGSTPASAEPTEAVEEFSAPEPTTPPPASSKPAAPEPAPAVVADFNPNESTDAKVITTYPISEKDKKNLSTQHKGAYSAFYSKKKYQEALDVFARLVDDYPSNYLSAYWAGMSALKIKGHKEEASQWFDNALEINTDYKPAITERAKLGKKK
jgi:tetratricopeptide (TPR) repeat protein